MQLHADVNTHAHIHTHIYVLRRMQPHADIHAHARTYTHTHTHTCAHAHHDVHTRNTHTPQVLHCRCHLRASTSAHPPGRPWRPPVALHAACSQHTRPPARCTTCRWRPFQSLRTRSRSSLCGHATERQRRTPQAESSKHPLASAWRHWHATHHRRRLRPQHPPLPRRPSASTCRCIHRERRRCPPPLRGPPATPPLPAHAQAPRLHAAQPHPERAALILCARRAQQRCWRSTEAAKVGRRRALSMKKKGNVTQP